MSVTRSDTGEDGEPHGQEIHAPALVGVALDG